MTKQRRPLTVCIALAAFLIAAFFSLRFGSSSMSWKAFLGGLLQKEGYETETIILCSLRLPRMLAGVFAGAGLALSGSLLQRATDNALAAPSVLGINAGAGFAVILFLSLFPTLHELLPFAAFVGALASAGCILGVSGKIGLGKTTVVLTGVALSALFQAGISFFSVLDEDVLASYTDFSVGGLRGVTMEDLLVPAPMIALCLLGALYMARPLNLFCLGDTMASSLGVSVKRTRLLALLLSAASAAAAVSFAGLLGFVGLIVPHAARKIAANDARGEILLSALCGGTLLLFADLLGRVLFTPTEIPVGIFTAVLGVPFFLWLLLQRRYRASI